MDKTLTLYTGEYCHLCEQAKTLIYPVLHDTGWSLCEVNISDDAVLTQQYGTRIPVIVTPDGNEKGWPFTAGQVRRMLQQ